MKTAEDVESYLIRMEAEYELVGKNIWLVKDTGPGLVVSIVDPVVVLRVKIIEVDKISPENREKLYKTLLEFNAAEMLHGAYGLEEGAVVLTDALQLENLDFNEFQAAMDDIGMAVARHYATLSRLAA
ncbi:MAG: hypothetical protein V1754_13395 [Pseudomonadota bacterium]